ncbi:holo-ACP synthase [Microbacterium schleiferi]|uniref:Holo-[acyl-carrier-protein] synthase n=1 Tax=Microbacterium schleiferi TaxID=69362 RepID=A0A7S8RI52_9MICO|nr:holo-ACP synthase [Microbacterium schleiferi]
MIVGIGVDLVDIERFERTIARTPKLLARLFSPAERMLKPRSLAARYAAKEALIKALGGSDGVHWTEIEVTPEASGRPWFTLTGSTADVVAARAITTLHLSMSHDAHLATAYVIAESSPEPGARTHTDGAEPTASGAGKVWAGADDVGSAIGAEQGVQER